MSRRADGRKMAEWRGRFERFRRSGLSVSRFCVAEKDSVPSYLSVAEEVGRSVGGGYRSDGGGQGSRIVCSGAIGGSGECGGVVTRWDAVGDSAG